VGFNLNGYVLRPARVASGNAQDSNEAVTGVDRDHILPDIRTPATYPGEITLESLGYQVRPSEPVEPYADMYRAAVLEKPVSQKGTEEYCLFAASTGSLSTVESQHMTIVGGAGTAEPIPDTLAVTNDAPPPSGFADGTLSFYIRDAGQRDITSALTITVVRGDQPVPVPLTLGLVNVDPTIGKVTVLDPTNLLGGGFSVERGDQVAATAYVLGSPTFWWTRNDPNMTRFGWDGKSSRWLPLKGSAARTIGTVIPGGAYKLTPPPIRFAVTEVLPGSSLAPEEYALVRCGLYADGDSTPLNVLVVSDASASAGAWLSPDWDPYDAVVGVHNGVLLLNAAFASTQAGRTLWYNSENYQSDADGDLGAMSVLPTGTNQGFPSLSPTPEATDRPFLRIGSRRYLTPIPVDQDVASGTLTGLPAPSGVASGSFYWSKTTGKIVLSDVDIDKCVPGAALVDGDAANYEIPYLGARLYFDGIALSTQPIPIKAPVAALNEAGAPLDGTSAVVVASGEVYVPRAACMPPPGVSGVRWEADGTGMPPTGATITADPPQTRPNGSGLVRRIASGASRLYGDTFFFGESYAYENLSVDEYDDQLPVLSIKVPKNQVDVSRMTVSTVQPLNHTDTSRVQFRRRPVNGEPFYFRQAEVIPSVHADEARVFSRVRGPYSIVGTETIRFALDGVIYEWLGSSLNATGIAADYTAVQVAASLNAITGFPVDGAGVSRGRVFLRGGVLATGTVEIGWNTVQTDLSGHAALGFLPGWRVDMSDPEDRFRWLPDNGAYMGVFRSPVNMDRTASTPDIRAKDRIADTVLSSNIPMNPFYTVSPAPLVDVPGYAANSHFQVVVGLLTLQVENYQTTLDVGVVYDWPNDRFTWCGQGQTNGTQIPYPTSTLQLNHTGVFPETVSPLAMDDSSFGLRLRRATDEAAQTLPAPFTFPGDLTGDVTTIDFLMSGAGQPGQAVLVTPEGAAVAAGGKGEAVALGTTFSDPNVASQADLYAAVEVGYLLHLLNGENEGVYTISSKDDSGAVTEFQVSPPFGATESSAQWRIYEARERSAVDFTLLADVQQVEINHFPDEPFKIRLLTSTGVVGNPLKANVVDAIASDRIVSLRFGVQAGAPAVTPVYLVRGINLGAVVSSGLVAPDLTDPHLTLSVTVSYFQVRVGAQVFSTSAGNLTLNVGSAAPGGIDVNTATGEILIGVTVVSAQAGSAVYFDQSFLASANVPAATCEIDPSDGSINLSDPDETAYLGTTAYFVEQMVTVGQRDVVANPMNGSLLFNKPLRAMQIVEVNYFQADSNGDKKLDADGNTIEITEFLPLMVTLEQATYVNDTRWSYNPTGRTIHDTVEPFLWVGTNLMNFAGQDNATTKNGLITITEGSAVLLKTSSTTVVKINYGVLEAFGGEQAYTVSSPPVYRKPFWIAAEASTFVLASDRTADFKTGLLMLLGPTPLYIDSSTYASDTGETTVTIFPPPEREAGSRAPGRDAGLTLSDFAVSVSRGGGAGFMPLLDTAVTPLLEVDRGQVSVSFYGDVRLYMKTNHLLEIGGYPYLIVSSALSDDGYNTIVQLGTPAYKAHDNSEEVRVSVRRVYFPPPVEFTGISPFLPSQEYDLFLMGRTDNGVALPGKALVEGLHYTVNPINGDVTFQQPAQGALQPGEYLHFRYTRLIEVGPTAQDGAVLYPVYSGKYLFMSTPSVDNRLLGSVLKAQYSYRSQDSFYFAVEQLEQYLGEVSVVSAAQGVIPYSGGPTSFSAGSDDISEKGGYGLRGAAVNAQDQDRAARVFVEFFSGVIVAFEQVLEAIDGRIIGDRDGKFRFFVGHDKRYTPPGYEDEITGDLNQRLLWREVVDAWAPATFEAAGGWFQTKDDIYPPTTMTVPLPADHPGETGGIAFDPFLLSYFSEKQRANIKNDMDDRILVKPGRPRLQGLFFPTLTFKGIFGDMWEDHRFSRLFPTQTEHFSRLLPGINYDPTTLDPGFYTPGRDIEVPGPNPGETTIQTVRTTGTPNGMVANNALGAISNIVDVNVQPRQPRARIWAFYPEGSAELDTAVFGGVATTVGKATMVATVLTMDTFPIDPTTGFPAFADLMTTAVAGTVYSLASGNPDLATPAFEAGQRINYGNPDGVVYSLKDSDGNGIFIESVLAGCVLILGVSDNAAPPVISAITGDDIYTDPATGARLSTVVSPDNGYADTVFVGPGVGYAWDSVDLPTTQAEQQLLAQAIPDYRMQFDLDLSRVNGNFIDATLPTNEDNFFLPLQDIFGQKPPDPLSCVEGLVQFINTDSEPLKLPCLLGQDKDDSGDQQIPFMKGTPNEILVLREVAPTLEGLYVDTIGAIPFTPAYFDASQAQAFKAVYPNEVFVGDGALYEEALYVGYPQNPATLYTSASLRPSTDEGNGDNTGLGDLRRFDLLFSQVPQTNGLWSGETGILDVGDVVYEVDGVGTPATIEVPRFVSPTRKGESHRYTLMGWAARVEETEGGNEGVQIQASTSPAANIWQTTIDFSNVTDMPDMALLDDLINNTPPPGSFNAFVIRVYDPDPNATGGQAFLGAITIITGVGLLVRHYFYNALSGVTQAPYVAGAPVFTADQVALTYNDTAPGSPDNLETALGLTPGVNYDFRLDMDTYGSAATVAVSGAVILAACWGSTTAQVLRDRLTFTERLDITLAKPRDYLPANGDAVEMGAQLNLWEFAANGVPSLTVNDQAEINGGSALTFLNRYNNTPTYYVGTYDVGSETGALRAMSWEGHGNAVSPAEIQGITLSGAASSDLDETTVICAGTLNFWDGDSSLVPVVLAGTTVLQGNRNYLLDVPGGTMTGGINNIVAGDTCIVTKNDLQQDGAVKMGTYLVRHGIPTGIAVTDATSVYGTSTCLAGRQGAGATDAYPAAQAPSFTSRVDTVPTTGMGFVPPDGDGCLDLTFPRITNVTLLFPRITLTGVVPVFDSSTGCGWDDPAVVGPYRLYLVLKDQYATYSANAGGAGIPGWVVDADAVYSVEVTAITTAYDPETQTIVFSPNTATVKKADDSSALWVDFHAAATAGTRVSGMTRFALKQMGSHLPANNMVGPDLLNDGGTVPLMAGFRSVSVGNRNGSMLNPYLAVPHGDTIGASWVAGVDITHALGAGAPVANDIVVGVPQPADNTAFYEDRVQPVYGRVYDPAGLSTDPVAGVSTSLNLFGWGVPVWRLCHFGSTVPVFDVAGVDITAVVPLACLLPFDRLTFGSDIDPNGDGTVGDPGYYALSGVFIEPSFPRPVQNLNAAAARVTAASYAALTTDQIGARDYAAFGGPTAYEGVLAAIRRPRRFHQVQVDIISLIEPLRYVYQTRRGTMASYTPASRTLVADLTVVGQPAATNLGAFNNADVNIHTGDVVRVIAADGITVLDTAEIQRVDSASALILRRPGLTNPVITGTEKFEVYLEQAIVPHEQSNEQLLALLIQEVVYTRSVAYVDPTPGAENGGFIDVTNEMKDSDVTSWAEVGVQEDDYVVIDPAGPLYKTQEAGARPSGDMSVPARLVAPGPYIPGGPSKLDDNRGFYKITAVGQDSVGAAPGTLRVTGDSRFTNGEIFGDIGAEYVVMPTIDGSWLTGPGTGLEDQQALRPTAGPVGDSYYDRPASGQGDDGYKSVSPFAYRIIRPNAIFSTDTVELILFIRERMLSWIDEINTLWDKGGDYYVFQRDDQIEDVGSATDTAAGMGILSNLVVDSLKGLTAETPFANVSDGLSVLDRRFWILDTTLDAQPAFPAPADVYTQFATNGYTQRPVEPDLIDGVLNTDDLFRSQRYGWIAFRANRQDGSIRTATREKTTLERRLQKQRDALARQKGLDKA